MTRLSDEELDRIASKPLVDCGGGAVVAQLSALDWVRLVDELRSRRAADLELDDYETANLLWLMRVAVLVGLDTGDWCHQIKHKLEQRGHTSVREPNSSPLDTNYRLDAYARKRLLTDEDRFALAYARQVVRNSMVARNSRHDDACERAVEALTKLLATGAGQVKDDLDTEAFSEDLDRTLAGQLQNMTAKHDLLLANVQALTADLKRAEARIAEVTRERDEAIAQRQADRAKTLDLVLEHDRVVMDRDALESRLQLQQVRCFHCGLDFGEHERGTVDSVVREHVISCSEHPLAKERDEARAEVERIRPVFKAAKTWRFNVPSYEVLANTTTGALANAVDDALAKEARFNLRDLGATSE